jgi:DNA-binding XRE family transcriptional regulator
MSWNVINAKWDGFREAFDGFEPAKSLATRRRTLTASCKTRVSCGTGNRSRRQTTDRPGAALWRTIASVARAEPHRARDRMQRRDRQSPESDSNRRPLPYHRSKEGSAGALEDIEDRTLRTSEDVDDPGVSSSYGPNPAQEVSGANLHHSIVRLLKERREELDLSRRELARRVGINHSLISRMETGQQRVSLKTLERIAAALDMRLHIRLE